MMPNMSKSKIELGDECVCLVTGFKGVATGKSEFLNGCVQFGLAPKGVNTDGTTKPVQWVDHGQLKVVKKRAVVVQAHDTGGPPLKRGPVNPTPKRPGR